ncbi:hypothetical protein ExPUPEC61_02666 [Escherichia coli]|nr:hypothetical protein ExPUPEC61_02666 [Escherichia coli]
MLELIDYHGGDDNEAFNDHLPEVTDTHHHHAIGEEDNDKGTDNRARDTSPTTCQRSSTENCGTDSIHFEHIAGHWVSGLQLRGNNQTDKCGA